MIHAKLDSHKGFVIFFVEFCTSINLVSFLRDFRYAGMGATVYQYSKAAGTTILEGG
jgi:hypothetical protein